MTIVSGPAGVPAVDEAFVDVPENPRPSGAEVIWFRGGKGRQLRACICPALSSSGARGTVIVCPGRTEFIEKYFEVARDLQARGFAVLILDWPGQGLSERLLADNQKGHIDNFQTFMDALARGLDQLSDRLPRPYVSLAHSMGGAIALAAILENKVEVKAAAFCAPMWGIRSPFAGMRYIVWAMRAMGLSKRYAQKPGVPERFETNVVTHDRKRWDIHEALVTSRPSIGLGPVTWGWLGAALTVMRTFVNSEKLKVLSIPVFIATAEKERLVDNARQTAIAEQIPDVEHILVEGAYHEILMETDDLREQFWQGFDRMLGRAGV